MVGRLEFGVSAPSGPLAAAELDSVSTAVGTDLDFVLWFEDFASGPPLLELDAVALRGATPVITWEPWLWRSDTSEWIVPKINSGCYDDYVDHWAAELADRSEEILLRFGHEFNGTWYPWSPAGGTSAQSYVDAWRRIHRRFAARGADNVRWVWCPSAGMPERPRLAQWYPGDDVVDILGVDGYNWGATRPWSAWRTVGDIFGDDVRELTELVETAPILVTEVACAGAGGDKPAWITELVEWLAAEPRVTGLIWFDHDKETDWRLCSPPAAAAAMAAALAAR